MRYSICELGEVKKCSLGSTQPLVFGRVCRRAGVVDVRVGVVVAVGIGRRGRVWMEQEREERGEVVKPQENK
jgi:hypothetical protein